MKVRSRHLIDTMNDRETREDPLVVTLDVDLLLLLDLLDHLDVNLEGVRNSVRGRQRQPLRQ